MKKNILVIHGPNLNLLGTRETQIYGTLTLKAINAKIKREAGRQATVKFFQANGEGEIIDYIHKQSAWADGIVMNPAAYTHYSIAIRDAIAAVKVPTVEVHLSNLIKREKFRRISVIKDVCIGQIPGLGWKSYTEGLKLLLRRIGS